ncbi:DNA polymerase III subunit alpha, partial [Simkania negevensis]|nr:DNA polymerase III subunit alpha [Simkania negevensis]
MSWVPLHLHSQYSILDATPTVEAIAACAKGYDIPAVALTDHGNMHGAIDFYKTCKKTGVKPIIGCEVYVARGSRHDKTPSSKKSYHLVLIAKNDEGYHNLCKLTSLAFLEGFYYRPRVDKELLEQYHSGLICLSGCMGSPISQAALSSEEALEKEIAWHHDLFQEDFYLELQRHAMAPEQIHADAIDQETWLLQEHQRFIDKQDTINALLIAQSQKKAIPLVATNDIHYIERDDWKAHEILLNIQSGEPCEIWERDAFGNNKIRIPNPKRRVYPSHEMYFKSPEQMRELFADHPEAIDNTLKVAEKCVLEIDFDTKHYPVFHPPSDKENQTTSENRDTAVAHYLQKLCEENIRTRYTKERLAAIQTVYPNRSPLDIVRERLKHELDIITSKGMTDYLLIVWDFIHWAKKQGIPVGPGRGSGAGSIVVYLLGITDIEPLRFSLFFERFINPERLSYPDIDVDICMDRRNEVIDYTVNKYNKANVAQIITFGTMKAKMVIRDVARVLNIPLSKADTIAKLVPDDLNITLDKALDTDPDFYRIYHNDDEARRIIDLGKKLEGSIRSTGTHAAGIIISDSNLTDYIPVCNAKDSDIAATQYSMKPVEAVGMLKIDLLGLTTLTSIQTAINDIKERHNREIDWVNLPFDDKKTFDLLNRGQTLGIFQLESPGMQELAKQLHLDKFEEIIAVVALYRPGPMDMIPSFIARKHGTEPIEYDHPWMEPILSETYGVMVYQEQVMQIASRLANYSLGEGDVLRRAMGKKDMKAMAEQREKFLKGAFDNGIEETTSMAIFDKMEKFAAYGFNKSHATAYGYLAYVTAYLKANYPKEWLAALMTCVSDDTTKVAKFIREAHAMNINVLPPDINESGEIFAATEKGIRFSLTAIKGIGHNVVEAVVHAKKQKGAFKSLYNFFQRVDLKRVGKKTAEQLILAGAFDFVGWSRDELVASVEAMYNSAAVEQKEKAKGVTTFWSLLGEDDNNEGRFAKPPNIETPTPKAIVLTHEKERLGFFISGHPLDAYKHITQR